MDKKTVIYIVSAISVVVVAVITLLVSILVGQNRKMQELKDSNAEMQEQLSMEMPAGVTLTDVPLPEELDSLKQQLHDELDQMDRIRTNNEELKQKLAQEKSRARDLLAQLEATKASDGRRIAELTAELTSVRALLMDYVRQIDELNAHNQRLTAENTQVKAENAQVKQHVSTLTAENNQLTETVNRAKQLDVTHFEFVPLGKRDKRTRYVDKIAKLQFNYTIGKNITIDPGVKHVYLRVTDPKGHVLGEEHGRTLAYEDGEVVYSLHQEIEYGGEVYSSSMYWPVVEGEAQQGTYRAEFFCEGNLIGEFSFKIAK